MKHHLRSAQVWHVFSRDLTVLSAHPYVHLQSEWAIPAFDFPAIAGTHLPTLEELARPIKRGLDMMSHLYVALLALWTDLYQSDCDVSEHNYTNSPLSTTVISGSPAVHWTQKHVIRSQSSLHRQNSGLLAILLFWPSCFCRGCASNLEFTVGWTAKPGSPQCHLPTQLKDVYVSTIPGALSALEVLCDYALYKFTLHYVTLHSVAVYFQATGS